MRLGSNLDMSMSAFSTARLQTRVIERWNKAVAEVPMRRALADLILSFDSDKPLMYCGTDAALAGYVMEGFTRIVDRGVTVTWVRTGSKPYAGIHSILDLSERPLTEFPWESREAMTLLAVGAYNSLLRCTTLPIAGTHFSPTIAGCVSLCVKLDVPLEM